MQYVFWTALALVAYAYVGYPLLLVLMARLRPKRQPAAATAADLPAVTVVIPAHNEELAIAAKIESCLAAEYPADRLRVLVCSDGSSDRTNEVVRRYASGRVQLVEHPVRRGKMAVLNEALAQVSTDIVILSDAESHFYPDVVLKLVRHLQDEKVGAVFGWRQLKGGRQGNGGESRYWSLEKQMRAGEDYLGASIVCSGAILALRRRAYRPLPPHMICDDLFIPLDLRARGWKLVFEPGALVHEPPTPTLFGDFLRRVRLGAGGFQSLQLIRRNLQAGDFRGIFAYVSHKLLRWLTPFFLIIAVIAALTLAAQPLYQAFLLGAVAVHLLALWAFWRQRRGYPTTLLDMPLFFLVMNAAFMVGLVRCLFGAQQVTWEKIEGQPSAG